MEPLGLVLACVRGAGGGVPAAQDQCQVRVTCVCASREALVADTAPSTQKCWSSEPCAQRPIERVCCLIKIALVAGERIVGTLQPTCFVRVRRLHGLILPSVIAWS